MVVTNGSRCTPDYLRRVAPMLDWLTVSIDSLDAETNRAIGRHDSKGQPLGTKAYGQILAEAAMLRLRTKINTVVNRINQCEDMSGFIADSGIARWKVLQVMAVEGQNDAHMDLLSVTRPEFDAFVARHHRVAEAGIRVVPEPVTSIRGSYAMIDPQGRFFDSSAGRHTYSAPILNSGVALAFAQVSFDRVAFEQRGGSYDFTGQGTPELSADVPVFARTVNA